MDESKCGDREDRNGDEHDNGFHVADVMIMIMISECVEIILRETILGENHKIR